MANKKIELVTILLTSNRQIYKVASSLLDDADIEYYIKGDGQGSKSSCNSDDKYEKIETPIEIQVKLEKSVKARTLLADLQELDFDEQK